MKSPKVIASELMGKCKAAAMKSEPAILSKPAKPPGAGFWQKGLDFLLPPLCFSCRAPVEVQGGLCARCWSGLRFITKPYCTSCGFPFAHEMPAGLVCGSCHSYPPVFARARAAVGYDIGSRPVILSFKHGERTEGLATLAGWLKNAGGDLLEECDVIIPVPLHPRRLFKRRFNQSALLARALGETTGKAVDVFSLKRKKNTRSQGGLNARQRRQNVRAAFMVPRDKRPAIKGQRVLLIDDVMTTGATAENCTRALNAAGAEKVLVLTLARVVEPLRKGADKKKNSHAKS